MKAKAIVFREANKPTIEEVVLPSLRDGEILVEVQYSGVSIGTEQSIFSGERTHNGTFPLVGGYMASGMVAELGPGVADLEIGDRVAISGARLEGEVTSVWGGHMSRQVTAAESAVKIPDGGSMVDAAMHVLPSVGLNAVSMSGLNQNDTVMIVGQGLIGQFCGQFARSRGATVITVEPNELRRGLSRKYVTENVIDPFNEDVAVRVSELTDGKGPSVVVEATANKRNIAAAVSHLGYWEGKMVFLSWYPGEITFDFSLFHNNQVTAFFPTGNGGPTFTRAVLDCLARGAIVFGDNITDVVPVEQACQAYQRIIDRDPTIFGMVVDWRNA